jgi:hypothetical protein
MLAQQARLVLSREGQNLGRINVSLVRRSLTAVVRAPLQAPAGNLAGSDTGNDGFLKEKPRSQSQAGATEHSATDLKFILAAKCPRSGSALENFAGRRRAVRHAGAKDQMHPTKAEKSKFRSRDASSR